MKLCLMLCLLFCGNLWGGDGASGPFRSTIQKLNWGSLYYEPAKQGACQVERTSEGYRFTSSQGEVVIKGSEVNGYRLNWGKELLTINQNNDGLEIRGKDRNWILHSENGVFTLSSSLPKDKVVFERSLNTFTIKGAKGTVIVTADAGNLRIQSVLGITTVTNDHGDGRRTFAGPALDKVPYLGRGLFITFHGVGIFVDITRQFPMPEVAEWMDWRAILES